MGDDDGAGVKFQASGGDNSGVNGGAVDCAVEHMFVGDDLKGCVKEDDGEDFVGFVRELHLQVIADGRGAGKLGAA